MKPNLAIIASFVAKAAMLSATSGSGSGVEESQEGLRTPGGTRATGAGDPVARAKFG